MFLVWDSKYHLEEIFFSMKIYQQEMNPGKLVIEQNTRRLSYFAFYDRNKLTDSNIL